MQQLSPAQASPHIPINENSETLEHQAVYGKRHPTTTGLTWGYYGGRWGGFSVADGTVALTGSSANYLVVLRSTGVLSSSTASTNWDDTTDYARVYKLTTSVSAVTATEDHRAGPDGIHGGGGGGGGLSDGDKGDITVSGSGATWTIDAGAVTYAKIQDVSATSRVLGRRTAGAGDIEEMTFSQTIDLVGSAAQGDVLYRNATVWTRLAAGTSGHYLKTQGAGADPIWDVASGAGLTHWTESVNSSAPNGTVPVTRFLSTNAATNVDAALSPKGTGALLGQIPDNAITAGNKRGQRAVDWQLVRAAADEVASGAQATIGGGTGNKASGTDSTVAGGQANFATGVGSYVPGGYNCTADADYSSAEGYQSGVRGEYGAHAIASGIISGNLDSIVRHRVQRIATTNATPKVLTSDGSGTPSATNTIVVANYCAMKIHAEIIGRDGAAGAAKGWTLDAVVSKTGGAGSAVLIGSVGLVVTGGSAGLATATITAAVSGGGDNFEISVTGVAATNMQWCAFVTTTETVY